MICCGVFVWGYGIGFVWRICILIKMILLNFFVRVVFYGIGFLRIIGGFVYIVCI